MGDQVEQAYQRGDLYEKRKRLMTAWSEFVTQPPSQAPAKGEVVARKAGAQ